MRSPSIEEFNTSDTPPALFKPRKRTASTEPIMTVPCKVSDQTTAFSPPWGK